MCGIAGAIAETDRIATTLDEVRRMTARLQRRGPDGFGFGTYEGVAFGHARLATIDLTTGDQPQSNADGSVVVVVNGEIYNYVEVRAELEARGHRFTTRSDIEVIPHLYDEYGPAFVDHLRGMFAIALYDRRDRSLWLVRDRLGKKPIYWLEFEGRLYFASEIKALLEIPGIRLHLDHEAVDEFFTYQYVPAPRTVFAEIKKVPAGSRLIRRGGRNTVEEYWTPRLEIDEDIDQAVALERVDEILNEAVRLRLRADVPLGAFLSGGIDSNLVVHAAKSLVPGRLKTTTIDFAGSNAGEVAAARAMAVFHGSEHRERRLDVDVVSVLDDVSDYLDEPLGDSSTLPTYLVSKLARQEVTVALSGDGGDETFGGYALRYSQNLFLDRWRRRLGRTLQRTLVAPVAAAYPKADRLPKAMRLKWGLRNLSVDAEEAYFLDMSVFRPEDKAALYACDFQKRIDGHDARSVLQRHFGRTAGADLLSRLLWVDLKTYLGDGVLAKVDRMSMAHSLEVRSPLLDQELVEFALRLPSRLKVRGKSGKWILRRLAERKMGAAIAAAPKSGFAPPIEEWLRGALAERFREACLENPVGLPAVLDIAALGRRFEEHVSRRANHARPLWLALSFELWFRQFGKRATTT